MLAIASSCCFADFKPLQLAMTLPPLGIDRPRTGRQQACHLETDVQPVPGKMAAVEKDCHQGEEGLTEQSVCVVGALESVAGWIVCRNQIAPSTRIASVNAILRVS